MDPLEYRSSYHRHLPHFQPPGTTLFVTFRLAGSLPREEIERLMEEKARAEAMLNQIADPEERRRQGYVEERRWFGKWDEALDKAESGPVWLKDKRVAELMVESLHYRHGRVYELDAFCVMANHVHVVFKPLPKSDGGHHALQKILHSLKRHVGREANKLAICQIALQVEQTAQAGNGMRVVAAHPEIYSAPAWAMIANTSSPYCSAFV